MSHPRPFFFGLGIAALATSACTATMTVMVAAGHTDISNQLWPYSAFATAGASALAWVSFRDREPDHA